MSGADSDRLGEVLERCVQFLSELDRGTIQNQPIQIRIKYDATDKIITGNSAIRTTDLMILARAFVNMNQEPEEIPPLTNHEISDIPNEEMRSQLKEMRFAHHIQEQALKTAQTNLNAQLDVNRQCMTIIANLTELLKQRG